MTGAIGGGEIFVYDRDGHLVRTVGQLGEGPGEFGPDLRVAVGPHDTLYIMDDRHARLQVLTPDGTFVRSFAVPGAHRSFARLAGGSFMFFQAPGAPGDALFHRLSPNGDERVRLGTGAMADPRMETWVLSPARPEGFWAASTWRYEVHRWGPGDSVDHILARDVEWFPPLPLDGTYPSAEERRRAPRPPLVSHMHEDEAGRLWTFSWVPDPAWEPDIPMTPQYEWARRTFDTMIEVIDLASQQVIAALRHDGRLGPMCGTGLMYTIEERAPGYTYVRIVEPTLVDVR